MSKISVQAQTSYSTTDFFLIASFIRLKRPLLILTSLPIIILDNGKFNLAFCIQMKYYSKYIFGLVATMLYLEVLKTM